METERLFFREFTQADAENMFVMDSDPLVHKYLGENPLTEIDQAKVVIENIRLQYKTNGIGRWATFEKHSGDFIGWSGLKFITEPENNHVNYYDVGYRLIPKYWGKGYATEACQFALAYGFNTLHLNEIIGAANVENKASRRVLEKCGLQFVEKFLWKNIPCDWLKITKAEWEALIIL